MFSALMLICLANGGGEVCISYGHEITAPSYAECMDLFPELISNFEALYRETILPEFPGTTIEHMDAQCVSWTNS